LTSRLRKNPRVIVVLEEIEKAHVDVLTLFLQVFSDGRVTDTETGVVHCQNAIFIMTSNLASDHIKMSSPELRKMVERTKNRPQEYNRDIDKYIRSSAIYEALKLNFHRDEFIGRINQIMVFLPLTEEEIHDVVDRELTVWKKRAEETHRINFDWSPQVLELFSSSKFYDVNFGARSVMNKVRQIVIQKVAEAQIRGHLKANDVAHLNVNEVSDIELVVENRG